ncbi:Uroporphyrin-III C/tetrapyrrole (Corrin/Porphyrin) methyltransferase [Xylanimonas cellulosilytica DSM 15894]|uniref:Ribosomal RNA small subunit methyltransferase I n=1 Tax=Xylanimonas cellulosilytica (strain DSM 15894 / JCM 12276 / CECT 5975 / KCTC 9989 / LMG 20990 / NBRC 107835 / XIL07) TaxID=446471 RepID=D1BXV8_XYLCX|nr:16S rRNA (cytidine(1402)-2'-O)-methyltransferase [Xylanimonas cellulosilytica]ACZ31749.1 Uroporphyrin-III C/tetrapyrrole (Corrin/Porphyrin) methyltransferase [Xylanimonas cellulosilytica DSM 15894]
MKPTPGDAPRPEAGSLVLAATPIGNTEDASPRLRRLLATADVVAAEDTRRLHALADRLGVEVQGRVVSFYEHNEAARTDELLDVVDDGGTVVVVTDAGMPAVSDPGFRAVARAVERGVRVTAAPGPSAVLTALALSGLPTDRFTFEGFAPRKPGDRARAFGALAAEPRTMVFFEAPHRIAATLAAMAQAFGAERPAAVCRELTKTYEEVLRGPLATLAAEVEAREADGGPGLRGEICVVVGGAPAAATPSTEDLVAEVLARVAAGERLKEAAAAVAEAAGVSRRTLYNAALATR